ncbi:MAG: MFS transporter [Akkermansiaceae bacterium]|nr:MFS transporter [Akkermansiaceae bacterium]
MSALPSQTKFIVGNEACERFSFYGMRSILTLYMIHALGMEEEASISVMHGFVALNYVMPLLGAWIADRWLGRYHTILFVSLFYCVGHGVLASADLCGTLEARRWVLYIGLFIIALGSGGIKPSVSAFVGDQMQGCGSAAMTRAYSAFYWSINLGSFFAFLLIPPASRLWGYGWAFGIPGIAMGAATFIFWLGRKRYRKVPPGRRSGGAGIFPVLFSAALLGWRRTCERFEPESILRARNMARILLVFALVIPFWSLFDQMASSWVVQGNSMRPIELPFAWLPREMQCIGAEQFQAANPVFVMIFVPLLTIFVYPHIGRWSRPLKRMSVGIILAALAYGAVAWLQWFIDRGCSPSIAWQLIPCCMITIAEVLVSATGLEYAFTQAAPSLKSITTSFWNLTITFGNLLVVALTQWMPGDSVSAGRFLLYGGLMLAVGVLFIAATARMDGREHGAKGLSPS